MDGKPGLSITFHEGLNALIGENDSGKTAIIDALKLVLLTQSNEYIRPAEDDFYTDGALYVSKQKKPLAGADAPSAKQYEAAVQELLTLEGLIRYNDAYQHAVESVRELSTKYTDLFSRRFQYVFIDEYQDCNQMQRDASDKLFNQNECCVFHIGDSDQAVYNSDNSEIEDWKPGTSCLSMASSN